MNWESLYALAGVLLGWLLNEIAALFRTRREDRKLKKKVLDHLLEVHFILNRLGQAQKFVELVTEGVLEQFPQEQRTNEARQYLNKFYGTIMNEMLQDIVVDDLDDVRDRYEETVETLASIDPFRAFFLRGHVKVGELIEDVEDYLESVKESFPKDQDLDKALEVAAEHPKPEIVKDAIEALEDEMKSLGRSLGLRSWFKVYKRVKQASANIDDKQKVKEYIARIMSSVQATQKQESELKSQ